MDGSISFIKYMGDSFLFRLNVTTPLLNLDKVSIETFSRGDMTNNNNK